MLVQTTSFTMVRRLSIYVSPFHSIHMNRIHYANYFGLTIWWRQQDGSGANRSFGVFSAHKFFSMDCETVEAADRVLRRFKLAQGGEGRGESDCTLPRPCRLLSIGT